MCRYKTRAHKAEGKLQEEASRQKTSTQVGVEAGGGGEITSNQSSVEDYQQLASKVAIS